MRKPGYIVLMGSGELTASMVEVHKMLMGLQGKSPRAVFLDTPAGFQPNVDQISTGAREYFAARVQAELQTVSYKSHELVSEIEAALALQQLRESDYVLMGPGSPTYTVDHLKPTRIPDILVERVKQGACLTAASAAALTMGRYTLPVYEIYKSGQPLHWVKGLDLLSRFGLEIVVVPHWNNAEGGSHDTSRCFMGEDRFIALTELLEEELPVVGLDEHTACIIDLDEDSFSVRGIGGVTLEYKGTAQRFVPGQHHPLGLLRGELTFDLVPTSSASDTQEELLDEGEEQNSDRFWSTIHDLDNRYRNAWEHRDDLVAVTTLLEFDKLLWQQQQDGCDPGTLAQARDIFRELIVLLGSRPQLSDDELKVLLSPLVEQMIDTRQHYREQSNWQAADALRDGLARGGVIIEDSSDGAEWRLAPKEEEKQ